MKTYKTQIENAAHYVYGDLGQGWEKATYQTAFVDFLQNQGLPIMCDKVFPIYYQKKKVIDFKLDICINEKVVIKVMNKDAVKVDEELQFVNYLTRLHLEVGYIINFGSRIQVRIKYRGDKRRLMN